MNLELALSILSVITSAVAAVLSVRKVRHDKAAARQAAVEEQGRRYAELGWAYARKQPDSADPARARAHAVAGFIMADTAADGRRDFTDKQVAVFVDAAKK